MATPMLTTTAAMTPISGRPLSITPGSRVLQSPLSDETIWKRLREAGFDEDSIRRRDKAALIAYIAKLEAEIFDHQHHMGLLIMEKKELSSKYEESKASADTAEILSKRDQASRLSLLAEARKREEKLQKAIGVKDECIASVEKVLHELRAESAETKISAESKLVEAKSMIEDAQNKFAQAEAKLHAAESLQLEACRFRSIAERKLQEVEAREDDLRRRIETFKHECDEKEREINLERQSLCERKNSLQQEQDRLLDAQTLLNQREDYIFSRSEKLNQLEKELEDTKLSIKEERRAINDEKSNIDLKQVSLQGREEALIKREALLRVKEQGLSRLQENLASKESNEIHKIISSHEVDLRARKSAFDAQLEKKCKSVEDELEAKRRAWELREVDLSQREDLVKEREHELEVQSRELEEKRKDVAEISSLLDEKEHGLKAAEREVELTKVSLQREKEDFARMKLELNEALSSLEDRKQQLDCAKEKFEVLKTETSELSVLETKLKEEIDYVRAQKLELVTEADKLAVEKAEFEFEWESIDEKREELRKEVEHLKVERLAFSKFISDEYDSLRKEKDEMRNQYKCDRESLYREREDFMNKMSRERSDWLNKMQQERADFLLDVEMRRRDLEGCIDEKREELESSLREKEMAFEQEKKNELQHISSLKEKVAQEMEQVASEMKRLEAERLEINMDRELRNREWTELKNAIDELGAQREKLKRQRELLHVDREEINAQIEELAKLESVKLALDNMALAKVLNSDAMSDHETVSIKTLKQNDPVLSDIAKLTNGSDSLPISDKAFSPSTSARFSWIRRCTDLIFRQSSDKLTLNYEQSSLTSHKEDATTMVAGPLSSSGKVLREHKNQGGRDKSKRSAVERQWQVYSFEEPKVIVEVPPAGGEVAKQIHDVGNEISEEGTSQKSSSSISQQASQPKRKRRGDKSIDNQFDPPVGQKKTKRVPQHNCHETPSEQNTLHSSTSGQHSGHDDQHQTTPVEQMQKGTKESTVLIEDKITSITEVICEKVETDGSNVVAEPTLDVHQIL